MLCKSPANNCPSTGSKIHYSIRRIPQATGQTSNSRLELHSSTLTPTDQKRPRNSARAQKTSPGPQYLSHPKSLKSTLTHPSPSYRLGRHGQNLTLERTPPTIPRLVLRARSCHRPPRLPAQVGRRRPAPESARQHQEPRLETLAPRRRLRLRRSQSAASAREVGHRREGRRRRGGRVKSQGWPADHTVGHAGSGSDCDDGG